MSDYQSIVETITDLFVATDQRDWARARRCFAPEVRFDMSSVAGGAQEKKTPRQITDGFDEGLRSVDIVFHQLGNFLVKASAREATAFCYGTAYHHRRTPPSTRTFLGDYDIHLVNHDGWRIDAFKFNLKYIDETPRAGIEEVSALAARVTALEQQIVDLARDEQR